MFEVLGRMDGRTDKRTDGRTLRWIKNLARNHENRLHEIQPVCIIQYLISYIEQSVYSTYLYSSTLIYIFIFKVGAGFTKNDSIIVFIHFIGLPGVDCVDIFESNQFCIHLLLSPKINPPGPAV